MKLQLTILEDADSEAVILLPDFTVDQLKNVLSPFPTHGASTKLQGKRAHNYKFFIWNCRAEEPKPIGALGSAALRQIVLVFKLEYNQNEYIIHSIQLEFKSRLNNAGAYKNCEPLALDYVMPEDLRNGLELNQLFDKCLVDVNDVQKEWFSSDITAN